jgi:uncharacterized protein with ParB-like and HNH nuclease domain
MPGVKISGAEHPIKDIFSDDFLFEIPPYQRPYSWSKDQAAELFDDVLVALEETDPSDPDPYFLGSSESSMGRGSSVGAGAVGGEQDA